MLTITGGEVIEDTNGFDEFLLFTASLDAPLTEPVTFVYRARSGTAKEDADFDSAGTIVTIPVGSTTQQFSVRTVADNVTEADENVLVDIFNVSGTTLANGELRTTVQGVILDEDGSGLKRAAFVSDAVVRETDAGTKQAVFEVRLSQASTEAITLNYETRDGSAVAGLDYVANIGSVTIPAGQTSTTVSVDVIGDTLTEGREVFSLVVAPTASDASELLVDFAGGTGTIIDDDASSVQPTLTVTGADALEDVSGFDTFITYTATLSEPALSTVTFSYRARSGTADEPSDYDSAASTTSIPAGTTTVQFSVRTRADSTSEADENLFVDVFNVNGATLANGEVIETVQSVILDEDGTGLKRAVFVEDVILQEGDSGTAQAVFEITLSRAASEDITLNYETRDGTARAGTDYVATTGTITFAAGQLVHAVAVDVIGDTAIEGSEAFSLIVAPIASDASALSVNFAGGIATIMENDASSIEPALTVVGGEIVEDTSGFDTFLAFTATLSEPALSSVTFDYRARGGTADEGTDFDAVGGTITIPAGSTTAQFFVRTRADSTGEADESVVVDIFNVAGATLANGEFQDTVQGLIIDEDGSGLKRAITVRDVTMLEGDTGTSEAVFELRLSSPSDQAITFDYTTAQVTADSNADFVGGAGTVTFEPGQTVASVTVDVVGNTASEATETFQLVVTTSSAEIEGGRTGVTATATILDDDSGLGFVPVISISDAQVIEDTAGFDNFLAFTVHLSEPSSGPVSFAYAALTGTAEVGLDFDANSGTVTIPAGETSAQIFVRTAAESLAEADETMIVELTSATNAVFAGGAASLQATGTILDDDTPAPGLGAPRVIVENAIAEEGETMEFTVLRFGPTTEVTTGTFAVMSGTADAGSDFVATSGTFSFAIGELSTTVSVAINSDAVSENDETLVLKLSDLTNGVFPGASRDAYAIGTIALDEPTPPPVILGSANDDLLEGTAAGELIFGLQGADRIIALAGDDYLSGGDDNDILNGGDGDDLIEGDDGDDSVFAEAGNDTLNGGAGNDLLEGKIGADVILGGSGDDTLRGSDGEDVIEGGAGNDTGFGGNDDDYLRGGLGDDVMDGSGGDDTINGDAGADELVGETGLDLLRGGDGNDTLRGGGGADLLFGGDDDDLMFGSSGEDTLYGGQGNDTLEGNEQADLLFGDGGEDILRGGDGFDTLFGGEGNDTLLGGNGNDALAGGLGQDTLRGQSNADTFVFMDVAESQLNAADLIDGITGVGATGGDRIDLSAIDADISLVGEQSFTFLGELTTAQGLAAGAGSLWVEDVGSQTRLYALIDGDNVIDLAVRINDTAAINAADYLAVDFIL